MFSRKVRAARGVGEMALVCGASSIFVFGLSFFFLSAGSHSPSLDQIVMHLQLRRWPPLCRSRFACVFDNRPVPPSLVIFPGRLRTLSPQIRISITHAGDGTGSGPEDPTSATPLKPTVVDRLRREPLPHPFCTGGFRVARDSRDPRRGQMLCAPSSRELRNSAPFLEC